MISPNTEQLDQYCFFALVGNSTLINVGDAIIINTSAPQSVIGAKNTTSYVLGTVRAIVAGPNGGNLPLQTDNYTTASNNLTVAQVQVKVLPSNLTATYTADLDAVTGTTTNSQYFGSFNLSATLNGTLSEASYLDTVAQQFISYGVNPGNSSQVIGIWGHSARA